MRKNNLANHTAFRRLHFEDSDGMLAILNLKPKDRIHIDTHGIMPLASQREIEEPKFDEETPQVDTEELLKVYKMQGAPLLF
jgi:hypothetical protein